MQTKNHTGFTLIIGFLIISVAEESQGYTVGTQRGLNNVGNVMLACFLVEVFQGFTAGLLMTTKVVVGTVGNSPKLAPAEGETELDIGGHEGEGFPP